MNNTIGRTFIFVKGRVAGSNDHFVDISTTYSHTFALTRDGQIVGWGENAEDCPSGNDFIVVSTGQYLYSLALTRDGRVVGWGDNEYGQIDCPSGNKFVAIAAGDFHSLALTRDGRVVGWGNNYDGQINCPSGNDFIAIAAGSYHSLALTRDGRVVGWGWNHYGQIDCPVGNFVAISANVNDSVALTLDGRVIVWGYNCSSNSGKLNNLVAINARYNYALTSNGGLVDWTLPDGKTEFNRLEKIALPYDFLTRLNSGLKVLCNMPKYIKMEILEDYTEWEFRDLYYL